MELKNGDKIGIIALAGECDKDTIELAKYSIEGLGYSVILSDNIYDADRYFAGSEEKKVEELHKFFQNPEIKLILNARGGYGSIKLLDKIDYNIIKKNPKPFIGYSDITALLLMIYKKTGLITYHGPMGVNIENKFTYNNLIKSLSGERLEFIGSKTYNKGLAKGIIWGGNLSTVVSLCGLDFIPDEDFIFFAEDINEPVYKIDKMFTQLFNIENFRKNCKGIVLGDFIGVDNEEWLETLFNNLPCLTAGGFKITHNEEMITVPIGRNAELTDNILVIN